MASIRSCPTIAKVTRWKENFMSAERVPIVTDLNATIGNVAPMSIQEHLGYSWTRVAVGCAGSMPL